MQVEVTFEMQGVETIASAIEAANLRLKRFEPTGSWERKMTLAPLDVNPDTDEVETWTAVVEATWMPPRSSGTEDLGEMVITAPAKIAKQWREGEDGYR